MKREKILLNSYSEIEVYYILVCKGTQFPVKEIVESCSFDAFSFFSHETMFYVFFLCYFAVIDKVC